MAHVAFQIKATFVGEVIRVSKIVQETGHLKHLESCEFTWYLLEVFHLEGVPLVWLYQLLFTYRSICPSGLAWSLYKCVALWRTVYGPSATERTLGTIEE